MRKILLTVFCLCSVGLAYGQSKLDLQSQLELFKLRNTSIPIYNSRTRSFERPKSVALVEPVMRTRTVSPI